MSSLRRAASSLLAGTVKAAVRAGGRAPRFMLTYHGVGAEPGAVPAPVFEAQILRMQRAGFSLVPPTEMLAWMAGEADLPGRAAALTFDDGLADTARVAAPILRRLGVTAMVFPVTGFLGGPRRYASGAARGMLLEDDGHPETRGWDYMGWEDLDAWVEAGGQVGGHTQGHPFLSGLEDAPGRHEVAGSREVLARRYGEPPQVFCYPFGDDGGQARRWVQEAGYRHAVTSRPGAVRRSGDPLGVPRLPAPDTAGAGFDDLLFGIYRWRESLRARVGGRA